MRLTGLKVLVFVAVVAFFAVLLVSPGYINRFAISTARVESESEFPADPSGSEKALVERLLLNPMAGSPIETIVPRSFSLPRPIIGPDARLEMPEPEHTAPVIPIVKAVYTTGWIAGSSKSFPALLNFIKNSQVNALVVDIKDDTGTLSYQSNVPLAKKTGANVSKVRSMLDIVQLLEQDKVYPIARVVCFKDPHLAKARPDWAVRTKSGGVWYDRKGLSWIDPHNKEIWDYIIDLSKEAAAMGFKEIQFDYVRFASDGKMSDIVYPYADGRTKAEVIRDFLAYARKELRPYGVVISADIFGLVCSATDDLGIGQQLEMIAQEVDVICPMVYPSHYYPGNYGIANPNANPYEVVFRSLSDAQKRIEGTGARLRPWLQDFNLGHPYGRAEIQAQIKAARDVGIEEWLFWNPSCRYDINKY